MRTESNYIWCLAHARKRLRPNKLDRHAPLEVAEVQLRCLRMARQVGNDKHASTLVLAQVSQHGVIGRLKELHRSPVEYFVIVTHPDDVLHPVEKRPLVWKLGLYIYSLIAVN